MTSASGSAVAGEEYSITCAVMGADNLDATFRVEWQRPGGGTLRIGLISSVTHTFSPLRQGDAGEYTCEAVITTDLLLQSPLTQSDVLDITVTSKSVSVCVCIKYISEQLQKVETISYIAHSKYLISTCKCVRNDNIFMLCHMQYSFHSSCHCSPHLHVLVLGFVVYIAL